ncbi:MAG TPA: ECF-type sigma factor [Tepidisphaeraceae bacterium]|jgi:RNA polymerase sigma factor (TIGR02999 family)
MSDVPSVPEVLTRIEDGDGAAAQTLFALVYQDLRQRAAYYLAQQSSGSTLQPTAVVHEAYLKLAGAGERKWSSRRHFFNAAAEAMRQILVDHARRKHAQKRGGGEAQRVDLDSAVLAAPADQTDWESLDRALGELKTEDSRRYEVVMNRFFAGLPNAQIAQMLDVSERTVERDWKLARMYLLGKLSAE